jgi:catechol 2,3-dioxygenase-like lactoylglutathione lyase family enzyme
MTGKKDINDPKERPMASTQFPVAEEGFLVTHLVVAEDVATTSHFYADLLGGEVVFQASGAPTMIKLANTWVIVVEGGGGTPDKPDVTLGPPTDPHRFDAFMNIRVADIQAVYEAWSGKGVEFITPPIDNGGYEMRCYVRDPDGRIIEVGQHTGMLKYFGIEPGHS